MVYKASVAGWEGGEEMPPTHEQPPKCCKSNKKQFEKKKNRTSVVICKCSECQMQFAYLTFVVIGGGSVVVGKVLR